MINQITCTSNNTIQLSRGELITWVNTLLKTSINKIQQLGTGAAYCQLLDILYPGKVPLSKVNFKSKFDYQYLNNFKVLQQSFTKLNIMKHIDVQKLVKCKYQDNLQFLQWFKKIFQSSGNPVSRQNDPLQKQVKKLTERSNLSNTSDHTNQILSENINRFNSISSHNQSNYSHNQSTQRSIINEQPINPQNQNNKKQKQQHLQQIDFDLINKSIFEEQKQFYLRKFQQIQHLMQNWNKQKSSQELIGNIRKIILTTPQTNWKIEDGEYSQQND